MTCHDCAGARSTSADVGGVYAPCPCCVIEAEMTFVCFEEDAEPET